MPGATAALSVGPELRRSLRDAPGQVHQRQVSVSASRYLELVGWLEVRRQPAVLLGASQSVSLIADKGGETRTQMLLLFSAVILLVLLAGFGLARALVRPIALLVEACKAMAAGDLSHEVPLVSSDETVLLTATFNQSLRGLRERDRARGVRPLHEPGAAGRAVHRGRGLQGDRGERRSRSGRADAAHRPTPSGPAAGRVGVTLGFPRPCLRRPMPGSTTQHSALSTSIR